MSLLSRVNFPLIGEGLGAGISNVQNLVKLAVSRLLMMYWSSLNLAWKSRPFGRLLTINSTLIKYWHETPEC